MIARERDSQMNFNDQFFHPDDDPVPADHPYLRIMAVLDDQEVLSGLEKNYSENRGRPAVPPAKMAFLLVIKHVETLSDEELVEKLRGSLPMQKALNITFKAAQKYLDPSSLSKFRDRIGEEGVKLIYGAVERFIKKNGLVKGRTIILDTTAVPSDIAYPTDIQLLEKARKFLLKVIKRYAGTHVRTHCRRARKVFLHYIKFKNAKRLKTRLVHGKMLRFVKRNLAQARVVLNRHMSGKKKITKKDLREIRILETIGTLLEQQKEVHRQTSRSGKKFGIHIPNRIVSIFREFVRPIPRGKIPQKTEFGAKILLGLRSGFIQILGLTHDNQADCEMIKDHFPHWTGMIVGGDRGFHSPVNTKLAAEHGLKGYYVERKGKRSLPRNHAVKRIRKLRPIIEAKISLAKRKHGLNRNRYGRGRDGESQWIYLGITGMNLKSAIRKTALRTAA